MDGLDSLSPLGTHAHEPASHDDAGRRAARAEAELARAALQVWRARGWTLPTEATRHTHIRQLPRDEAPEGQAPVQVRAARP